MKVSVDFIQLIRSTSVVRLNLLISLPQLTSRISVVHSNRNPQLLCSSRRLLAENFFGAAIALLLNMKNVNKKSCNFVYVLGTLKENGILV